MIFKRFSELEQSSSAERVRSERVYDVAYCQAVLADLLPGTIPDAEKCDAKFSISSQQLLKIAGKREEEKSPTTKSGLRPPTAPLLKMALITLGIKDMRDLRDISLYLSGGDLMAIMFGSELEAKALLNVLSGADMYSGRLTGSFSINGHALSHRQFASRIAHVTLEDIPEPLTVVEYLRVSAALHPPANRSFKIENMIDQIVATLALAHQRHSLCSRLTKAETVRLRIAAELLKDTDILLCGNVAKQLDIYELAFVVDYLRDWAAKLNRIVVMALSPPSFENLLMFSQCALITSGRLVFSGCPTEMLPYFISIDFPCPKFKNPCDYYVDLATHDHQSAITAVESADRIAKLVASWEQHKPAAPVVPKSTVSPMLRKPSIFPAIEALSRKTYYEFTNNPLYSFYEPAVALLMSLAVGLAFTPLTRNKRASASDRLALTRRKTLHQLVHKGGIPVVLFFCFEVVLDIPQLLISSALYSFPLTLMTGMNIPPENQTLWWLSFYLTVLIHILLWRTVFKAFVFFIPSVGVAFFIAIILLTTSHLTSGLVVHPGQNGSLAAKSHWMSPHRWISQALLEMEFLGRPIVGTSSSNTSSSSELIIGCGRREVLAKMIKDIPIYTISQCSSTRGKQLLYFYGFTKPLLNGGSSLSPEFYLGSLDNRLLVAQIRPAVLNQSSEDGEKSWRKVSRIFEFTQFLRAYRPEAQSCSTLNHYSQRIISQQLYNKIMA
ncbi:unnamed protein product [Nippostrongylus brasiliensis]|uniref:ABC transporter domain-containing protein n=1 Tax=Nippostrongylus brasiliensis TaxID=27835 RepID=A0A0N4YE82_NIPBR|nr:unnamed protein product [Nippostrongylus brasiliensis]